MANIMNIIRNLDNENTGYVNWRVLYTYIILLKSEIPDAETPFEHINNENGYANEEDFMAANFWFEESERSQDRDYSLSFERAKIIKQLLYRTNHTTIEGGRSVINLGEFARRVCVAD
jgi:hypothetical protein